MKKFFGKRSALLLAAAMIAALAALFVACGKDRPLHIWAEEWTQNAQYHWHACTDAGCPGKDEYAYHDFALIETIKDPTCSAVGRGKYKCGTCGYEKEDDIEMIPHTWELEDTLMEPTCYTPGRGTFKCKECEARENQPIEPTGEHVFEAYAYDETGHWQVCSTEGCTAKTETLPHDSDRSESRQPSGWVDGAIDHYCTVCGGLVSSEALPSPLAPAEFDMEFDTGAQKIEAVPREPEDGIDAFDITVEAGKEYLIHIKNAVNGSGDSIDISEGDIVWDVPTLHGLKAYYINDRNAEQMLDPYASATPAEYRGTSISFPKVGAIVKIIFRYETGVNDENLHNRKIKVSKIYYFNVVERGSLKSTAVGDLKQGARVAVDFKKRYDELGAGDIV